MRVETWRAIIIPDSYGYMLVVDKEDGTRSSVCYGTVEQINSVLTEIVPAALETIYWNLGYFKRQWILVWMF